MSSFSMSARSLFALAVALVIAHADGCSGSDSGTSGTSTDSGVTQGDGTSEGGALDGDAIVDETSSETSGETAPICPPNDNPAGCPDHYFEIPKGAGCSPEGLSCRYYGEGDEPCPSYAACTCTGVDGGTATWTHCVQ